MIVGAVLGMSSVALLWMLGGGSDDTPESPGESRVSMERPTPDAAPHARSRRHQRDAAAGREWRGRDPAWGAGGADLYSYPQAVAPSHEWRRQAPGADERYRFRPLSERERQRMQAAQPDSGYSGSGLPQAYSGTWGIDPSLQRNQRFPASQPSPRSRGYSGDGYWRESQEPASAPRQDWSGPAFETYQPPPSWHSPYQHNSLKPAWEHAGRYSAR